MGTADSHSKILSNKDLLNIIAASPIGMAVTHTDGSFAYANPSLMRMLGYSENEIYDPSIIITHPEEFDKNHSIRQQLMQAPDQPIVLEKRYLHKNGRSIIGLVSMISIPDDNQQIKYFVSQVINIESQKRIEKSAQLFRSMINSSTETMFIINPSTGKILDSNIKGCDSLGYSYEKMLSMSIFDIDANINQDYSWDRIIATLRNTRNTTTKGIHRRKDGSTFPTEMSISYIELDDAEYVLALVRDITERQQSEELIWRQANYDSLTELPNRHMLHSRLKEMIRHSTYEHSSFAVMYLDLDKFKNINDALGHFIGDQLLFEAGQRIEKVLGEQGLTTRLGGDEFCLVIQFGDDPTTLNNIANHLLTAITEPFMLDNNKIFTSTSIGISLFPNDANNADDLCKHADQAMYAAKEKGRNRFQYFTASMQQQAVERMHMGNDLHTALREGQFYIHYQPIVSLKNPSVEKVEALLRWQHPTHGNIFASDFIPVAEENGTIDAIGDWLFTHITQQILSWQSQGKRIPQVSINASPLYFREGNDILDRWQQQLIGHGLPGDAVVIEITEGLLLDSNNHVTECLLKLRDAGIQVALDDFGTGYSSLSYLNKLDIDYLKIDKSFIDQLAPESHEEALCEAIIVMAHKLKLQVIAEGIETEAQYQMMVQFGCDYGQGFYFSKAVSAEDIALRLPFIY